MCANYRPTQRQLLRDIFGVEPPAQEWAPETWPNYTPAPIVRIDGEGRRHAVLANFGINPKGGYDTFNARSETVGEKRNFAPAWRQSQLCLVPAESIFEPNYEADPKKSVRYRIWTKDAPAFAIAGIWREFAGGLVTFAMLTVNADAHPIMRRMHKPGAEKRSVVFLPPEQWDDWLACRDPELARTFMQLPPADALEAEPAPLPPRKRKTADEADTLL